MPWFPFWPSGRSTHDIKQTTHDRVDDFNEAERTGLADILKRVTAVTTNYSRFLFLNRWVFTPATDGRPIQNGISTGILSAAAAFTTIRNSWSDMNFSDAPRDIHAGSGSAKTARVGRKG